MDAGDWIAIGVAVISIVFQSVGVAMYVSRVGTTVSANTKTIESLADTKVSIDTGKGYQAQLERHEKALNDAASTLQNIRNEYDARFERATARFSSAEQMQNTHNSSITAGMAKLEAVVAGMAGNVERLLEVERQRLVTPPPQPDLMAQLQQLVALSKMMRPAV